MVNSAKSLVGAVKARLGAWLSAKVYYLDANSTYYSWRQQQLQPVSPVKAPILVLSRFNYDEKTESFAINSASALRKILKQQQNSPLSYHFIGNLVDGQRKVITITPKSAVLQHCLQARLVLPISLLVQASQQQGMHKVSLPDGCFYQLNRVAMQSVSLPQSALISTSEQALQILGGHVASPCYSWSTSDFLVLCQKAFKLPLSYWQVALTARPAHFNIATWWPFVTLAGLVASCYLLLASYLLNHQIMTSQRQLTELNNAITPVLETRNVLQRAQAQAATIHSLIQVTVPGDAFWEVFALAQLNNVQIIHFEADVNQLHLRGTAPNALNWLQLLLTQPQVQTADFNAPVRRTNNNQDQFDISMRFAAPTAVSQEPYEQQ